MATIEKFTQQSEALRATFTQRDQTMTEALAAAVATGEDKGELEITRTERAESTVPMSATQELGNGQMAGSPSDPVFSLSVTQMMNILEDMSDAIYTVDEHWHITYINRKLEEIGGHSRADLIGHNVWAVFPHVVGSPVYYVILDAMRERRPITFEYFVSRTNRWFCVRITPNGAGLILHMSDITERRRMEAAQAHLAAIIESSDDAIISKSMQSIITSWNKRAETIFGYTAAETMGRSIMLLFPPQQLDEEFQLLERIWRSEIISHYKTVRRRKDGTDIAISLTLAPIRDHAGTIIGASKIVRDLTARKPLS